MPVSSSTLILIVIALQQGLFAGLWALAAVAGMSRRAALHWSAGMLVVAVIVLVLWLAFRKMIELSEKKKAKPNRKRTAGNARGPTGI